LQGNAVCNQSFPTRTAGAVGGATIGAHGKQEIDELK
jgi:hypothetical protein